MDTKRDQAIETTKDTVIPSDGAPAPAAEQDGEFKIEIRKLEVPVRPRGVLAE
ncbi:MAG TPA: hypothetical protein VHO06_00540 [Polyangia bacterium]|nr:hypothetical protein [Polyangia bacterium]